jgi:histone-lysine N-methyltransferase ASH1L
VEAEEDEEGKILFPHLRDMLQQLASLGGEQLVPSRDQLARYNQLHMTEPLDLAQVEAAARSGQYRSWAQFDRDLRLVFQNAIRFFGRSQPVGRAAHALRTAYLSLLSTKLITDTKFIELVGPLAAATTSGPGRPPAITAGASAPPLPESSEDGTDDIISCPCDQYRDEGVMVQCETCGVWQHTDCVLGPGQDPSAVERFLCDPCAGRRPNLKIPLVPQPEYASPGETYYVSLEREDGLHVTLGTTVYVLRAFKEMSGPCTESSEGSKKLARSNAGLQVGSLF